MSKYKEIQNDMNNQDTPRKWYQKKRYIIPAIALGILTMSGGFDNTDNSINSAAVLNAVQENSSATIETETSKELEFVKTSDLPTNAEVTDEWQDTEVQPEPTLSNDNHYTNVDGETVHSPAYTSDGSVPTGASAQCRDGTYSFSKNRRGTCSRHGGVARWY